MSCHTWIFKKASALSNIEKQQFVDAAIKELKNWWGFNYSKNELIDWVEKHPIFYKKTQMTPANYASKMINERQEKIHNYERFGFDAFLKYNKNQHPKCIEYNGETYVNIAIDMPFRVFGYPSEKFIDVDSLLSWTHKSTERIGYYDHTKDFCFIDGYTSDLEQRIKDFFDEHGKDNLLISFG